MLFILHAPLRRFYVPLQILWDPIILQAYIVRQRLAISLLLSIYSIFIARSCTVFCRDYRRAAHHKPHFILAICLRVYWDHQSHFCTDPPTTSRFISSSCLDSSHSLVNPSAIIATLIQWWIRTGTARNAVPVKFFTTGMAFRLRFCRFEFSRSFTAGISTVAIHKTMAAWRPPCSLWKSVAEMHTGKQGRRTLRTYVECFQIGYYWQTVNNNMTIHLHGWLTHNYYILTILY